MPHLDDDFTLPAQAAADAAAARTKDVQALQALLDTERANSERDCRAECRKACQASCQAATRAKAEARQMRATLSTSRENADRGAVGPGEDAEGERRAAGLRTRCPCLQAH